MNIFIVGATGHTGKLLARLLSEKEDTVYAMVRNLSNEYPFPEKVKVVKGDLEEDLNGKLDGMDVAIFAAGSGSKTGPEKTITVDQEGAKALIDEAKRAGIKRFVMLSSKGAEAPEKYDDGIRHYMKAKRNADDYLQRSGVEYVILRPVRLTFDAADGTVSVGKTVNANGTVSREDVASFMASAIYADELKNKIIELESGSTPVETAIQTMV